MSWRQIILPEMIFFEKSNYNDILFRLLGFFNECRDIATRDILLNGIRLTSAATVLLYLRNSYQALVLSYWHRSVTRLCWDSNPWHRDGKRERYIRAGLQEQNQVSKERNVGE